MNYYVTEEERSSREMTSPLKEPPNVAQNENDVTNDLESKENASKGGADITYPGVVENEKTEKILALEEGNIICDLTLPPTLRSI